VLLELSNLFKDAAISKSKLKRFFKKIGISYKRAKKTIMQDVKWKNYWDKVAQIATLKDWATKDIGHLYFYDESGFSLNSNIPYRWSVVGVPTPLPANRFSKRINVLGFLNTQTKHLFHRMTTDKVDTTCVVEFFDDFAKQIKKATVVVLDNASIHTSKKFKEQIEKWEALGLYLLYLPPYSPELNPIEILWREMKYRWVDLNALISFDVFQKHVSRLLNGFGFEYDIKFV